MNGASAGHFLCPFTPLICCLAGFIPAVWPWGVFTSLVGLKCLDSEIATSHLEGFLAFF